MICAYIIKFAFTEMQCVVIEIPKRMADHIAQNQKLSEMMFLTKIA